ncbi:ProP Permease of the major facilitator superfamily [Pyrenophora tritici-repentis]|uniref:Major Facilitator Superprotein n=2 Tax=Pyrenophora tritici-repentis TaxID=45151 RepID=A0A2W1EKA5_9PLEO|nr:ProP Permease major facilitator superfamily [Pyrenophora tritici-repentis]KAF7568288.1 ProP, Permease major facilitator superfamily [Pyrenophora tritici-repentis]KAI0586962.1 ProP Permease major facilitator superfamily [Pyrenophora tritici-repentis]KAI0588991.1 ProP Permease major facilitator superfamily [Pyrenophora tritici-repentis]KAI0624759.1 ProP Permease major facilitator superfamily [Pyrenophora tritici-repentis]
MVFDYEKSEDTMPSPQQPSHMDVDLENGRQPRSRQRDTSITETSSGDYEEEEDKETDHDGHRPSRKELHDSISRSRSRRSHTQNRVATGTASGPNQPLSRAISRRDTVLSRIRTRPNVAPFSHPLAHQPTTHDVLVDFDGDDDPYRPVNWPTKKKINTTLMYGLTTMSATWASSSYSAGTRQIAAEFNVGNQVAVLGTTLFLFGFGLGPLLWAPLSEVYGRRIAVLTPMFVAICFSFGSAVAKDFQTLMITRFFGAFFASAPVTNTGGVLGDLYSPAWRAMAMAGYAMAVVGGPCLGPIVSAAFVATPSLGWRWTEYFTGILQACILFVDLIFIDESYPPKLLIYKARRLRHETGNWALHTKFEEWDVSIKELSKKFLIRPIQLLMTPICFLVALYASFCYGILYMQLGGIPIIFRELRGWPAVSATLPFLGILVGAMIGCSINAYNQILYNKVYHAAGDRAVPEARLPPMMLGSALFSVGQFIMGWTAGPEYPWIAPVIGLVLMGTGFFTIFQAALNYLVDTFTLYAASAVAANTFLRSVFAGAFPLVVTPLYHNIGVGPASSITGGFAALLIPVPFVFYIFGKRIRGASKWSRKSVFD